MRQKNIMAFRNAAICAASLVVLGLGFQNCAQNSPAPPPTQTTDPSRLKPVVPQLCEDAEDNSSCLTRAQCLHAEDRECTNFADFEGDDNKIQLDKVGPVLMYSSETRSLWAGLQKEDVDNATYQWYKNDSFYSYHEGEIQSDETHQYFTLRCDTSGGIPEHSVEYYYAKASYGDKTLYAPFLVACSQWFPPTADALLIADEGVERKECASADSCDEYTDAGELSLARLDQGLRLQVLVDDEDDDLEYNWYLLSNDNTLVGTNTDDNFETWQAANVCDTLFSTDEVCRVARVNDEEITGNELPIYFDDSRNDGCTLNQISYYKAVVTKSSDAEYRKTALFHVACVENTTLRFTNALVENSDLRDDLFLLGVDDPMVDFQFPKAYGRGHKTYSIERADGNELNLPAGLSFDPATRTLSGTPTTAQSEIEYKYKVTNEDDHEAELNFSIEIDPASTEQASTGPSSDAAPRFNTDDKQKFSSPAKYLSPPYYWLAGTTNIELELPAATGGQAPLSYRLDIPSTKFGDSEVNMTGLHFFDDTRVLAGIPSTYLASLFDYRWLYTVTDAAGETDRFELAVNIRCNPATNCCDGGRIRTCSGDTKLWPKTGSRCNCVEPLAFSSPQVIFSNNGQDVESSFWRANTPLSITLPEATGGCGDKTKTLTTKGGNALPSWLSFNSNTRILSGTPPDSAASARMDITYRVADQCKDDKALKFELNIGPSCSAGKVAKTDGSGQCEDAP